MSAYAAETSVSPEKSRAEIETTLRRYGETHFGYMTGPVQASIAFEIAQRRVRFTLEFPDRESFRTIAPDGRCKHERTRSDGDVLRHWEQAQRQRWRALALVIKAKLEAVQCGITTVEEEFLAHIVLPNGSTAGEFLLPQIERAYSKGEMPRLLEAGR